MSSQYQKFVDENENVIHTKKQILEKEKDRLMKMRASESNIFNQSISEKQTIDFTTNFSSLGASMPPIIGGGHKSSLIQPKATIESFTNQDLIRGNSSIVTTINTRPTMVLSGAHTVQVVDEDDVKQGQ